MNPIRIGSIMLTKTDLAAYLSRCPRRAELAFRLKYSLDGGCKSELWSHLVMFALAEAERENWPLEKGKHYLRNMCDLAIQELRQPLPGENWAQRAKAVGVDKTGWIKDGWKGRYEIVHSALNDWVNQAYKQIKRMQAA